MKTILLILILFFLDTGDTFPTSGTIANRSGGVDNWTNPSNITADDGSVTTVASFSQSHYLIASGFGFSIPPGSTINTVTVKIETTAAFATPEIYANLQDDNGALIGSDKFIEHTTGTTPAVHTYAVDNWGASLTPSIVNDPDFGVRFWVQILSEPSIDYVTVSINYTQNRRIFNTN